MWQGSEYVSGSDYRRVLNIPGFWVCWVLAYARVAQDSEYAWIWLNNALWQGSEHARSTLHRVLNKPPVLNMLGLRIWQGFECATVTQGAEYVLISLNTSYKVSQYIWIYVNNAELGWMCWHIPEKHYWILFRTLSNI